MKWIPSCRVRVRACRPIERVPIHYQCLTGYYVSVPFDRVWEEGNDCLL